MLPWFKADTDLVIDGMLDHEWTTPIPFYCAVIEWCAIVAAGRAEKWSHARLAKRWNRPICWVRSLKAKHPSQANRRQIADESQDDSRVIAGSSQDDSKVVAAQSQGRSSSGRASGDFLSKVIAGSSQDDSRVVAGSSQDDSRVVAGSCAREDLKILEILDRDIDRDVDVEKNKTPLPPKGGISDMEVAPAQLPLVSSPAAPAVEPVAAQATVAKPKKRTAKADGEADLPDVLSCLRPRSDARMWSVVWQKFSAQNRAVILEVVRVWDAYREVFPERRVLDDDGAKKIAEAVLLGFSVEELSQVPVGAKMSPFHMGQNDQNKRYIDPVSLYRETRTINAHIERAKGPSEKKRAEVAIDTRNAFGGRQECIDWDSELRQERRK